MLRTKLQTIHVGKRWHWNRYAGGSLEKVALEWIYGWQFRKRGTGMDLRMAV